MTVKSGEVDGRVLAALRELGAAGLDEVSTVLASQGITKSQVHNSLYRLKKAGTIDGHLAGNRSMYSLKISRTG